MRKSKEWHWYVYIIETIDGLYYTGRTWNIEIRYDQHLSGRGSKFTAIHGVKRLAYVEEHNSYEVAVRREIEIKDMNKHKKEKLIKEYQENKEHE